MYTAEQIRQAERAEAREMVKSNLLDSNDWLMRGLMAIYRRQTEAEKTNETTRELNGVGFSGADAHILTSIAKQWEARQWVSDKQLALLRKRMVRYAGQLMRIAKGIEHEAMA